MNRLFLLLITCIVIVIIIPVSAYPQSKKERSRILHMRQELKRELLNRNQEKLRVEKEKLSDINRKQIDLSNQLRNTEANLWKVENSIREIKDRKEKVIENIRLTQADIEVMKVQIIASQKALGKRLCESYKDRYVNYLAVLFDSSNFFDFLTRIDFMKLIVKNDLAMVDELKAKRNKLIEEEQRLARLKSTLTASENEYREKQKSFGLLHAQRKVILNDVTLQQQNIAEEVYEMELLSRELETQLEDLIREEQRLNETRHAAAPIRSEGSFIWPVTGVVTSNFGYRYHPVRGGYRFHSGIDIAASYGVPIRAAASGVVIMSSWYGGYGNAVVIDHGNGYSTLYGHCSALFVGSGQRVQQGMAIASIGSTGMSTGPHLHFEVRYQGNPIDPRSRI